MLDLIIRGELAFGDLQQTAKATSQMIKIEASLMGLIDPTKKISWKEMEMRFPEHNKQ